MRLVQTLHQADPSGMAFRFPEDPRASQLPYTSVENLRNLVEAHRAISALCDGAVSTHDV